MKFFVSLLSGILACLLIWYTGFSDTSQTTQYSDGPYIDMTEDSRRVQWICESQAFEKWLPKDTRVISPDCNLPDVTLHSIIPYQLSYQGDFDVVAMSDFHGQYELTTQILVANGIVDDELNWSFGNGHFVITGDVFDRGEKVTELLWLLYRLEQQANLAGGKVHLLLGNHEVMVLNGDLRYLHPKYVKTSELLDTPFNDLFRENTVLGEWLRNKPVLVKINNMLFAHGGFHPDLAKNVRTLKEINSVFKQTLVKDELSTPRDEFATKLHTKNGPVWYRGYFKDDGANAAEIDLLLSHFDIKHLIVGHTSQKQVETRFNGKVIAIDSSIKRGEYGELLLIENGKFWRGTPDGQKLELAVE